MKYFPQQEQDGVTFELPEYLDAEMYTDAFIQFT